MIPADQLDTFEMFVAVKWKALAAVLRWVGR